MLKKPWTCRTCLARALKARVSHDRFHARFQSTGPPASSNAPSSSSDEVLYPALLARARAIKAEHESISKQLEGNFTPAAAKKAGELAGVVTALGQWDKANESLSELRKLLRDPSTDAELEALASEDLETTVAELHAASQTLTSSLVPKHPFADLPCLMEIRPGQGGSEAGIFANDLFLMYQAYCAQNGLRCTVMEHREAEGTGDGLLEAVLSIESSGSYGILRCEAGVHRVQRVPETESKGRTHTSSASVMVLPSTSDANSSEDMDVNNPSSEFYVDPSEVKVDVMRASGAGGQHVNRTESAVRLTHLPTNTVVACQTMRSQLENRKRAWDILRSRLAQSRREAREAEMLALRRNVIGVAKVSRGDKIRTYNWSQQRITDHRSGTTVHGIEGIMAGGQNLEKLMESVRQWMAEREVESMVADAEDAK